MRRRPRIARAVAATAVLGGCLVVSAGTGPVATADSSVEQGWWWKGDPGSKAPLPDGAPAVGLPAQPPAAPAPPNVGEDDLMVAASVDGELAIAAVRTTLPDGQGMPALKLDVVDNGDINGSGAHLLACAANDGWVEADGGRWDMRPTADCEQSVAGVPASDGKSVTFPIQPLSASGTVNVAIVPTKDASGVIAPFQLVFKKATTDSIHTEVGGGTITGAGSDASADNFDSGDSSAALDSGFSSAGADTGSVDASSSSSSFASPTTGSASVPSGAGTGTSGTGTGGRRAQANLQTSAPVRTQPASSSTDGRALGLAVLLAGAAAAWFTTRQKLPTPHSLSRVASRRPTSPSERLEPTPGGLGRFARPRTGPPPKLF